MELCEYLNETVLKPLLAAEGTPWEARFLDFFTYDNGCDPLEPVGTIRLKVPRAFAGRVGQLEAGIHQQLDPLGIRMGSFAYETHPKTGEVLAVFIPIVENPTALKAPPDVNMSQTRGCVVLRDLLGYDRVQGKYEFTSEDLVRRVGAVTEERIAACTASPVKGEQGVRRTPSPASVRAVRRCLAEIQQFGLWAMQNNHRKLAAS
jgi:hypothetical protein